MKVQSKSSITDGCSFTFFFFVLFCYFNKMYTYHCELQLLQFPSACSQIQCQSIHEDVLIHIDSLKPLGSSEENRQDLARKRLMKDDIPLSIGIHLCCSSHKNLSPKQVKQHQQKTTPNSNLLWKLNVTIIPVFKSKKYFRRKQSKSSWEKNNPRTLITMII